ncbi:DinB family protein [Streptomyces montanus]|uniref:DinB family protein n=1 Tax=Streptomyces montanus TaxID=2580423 RepID=A0A5R9FHY1_9ACTN|nr:DinB family protein [Streptomyces montanus]TLS42821.1 DinB family protein [Streptomyces montanus]
MMACAECGFEYDLALAPTVSTLAKGHASEYAELLRAEPSVLRRRSAPHVWSPLEYACHMRDVLLAQRERALAARRHETPVAEPMGRDERVDHDGYARQQPADVARQLRDAALLFAHVLDRLSPADWERTLVYTYPEREERSLRWVAVHTLHELRHHLLDMRRQLEHHDGDRCDSVDAPSGSAH